MNERLLAYQAELLAYEAELLGMKALNDYRLQQGLSVAFTDREFNIIAHHIRDVAHYIRNP